MYRPFIFLLAAVAIALMMLPAVGWDKAQPSQPPQSGDLLRALGETCSNVGTLSATYCSKGRVSCPAENNGPCSAGAWAAACDFEDGVKQSGDGSQTITQVNCTHNFTHGPCVGAAFNPNVCLEGDADSDSPSTCGIKWTLS